MTNDLEKRKAAALEALNDLVNNKTGEIDNSDDVLLTSEMVNTIRELLAPSPQVTESEADAAVTNLQWLLMHYETMEFEETLKSLKTLIRAAQQRSAQVDGLVNALRRMYGAMSPLITDYTKESAMGRAEEILQQFSATEI